MQLSDHLTQLTVQLDVVVANKNDLLAFIAQCLADKTQLDYGKIYPEFIQREQSGSTGIGCGIALPHARLSGLTQPIGLFYRLQTPLDFDSLDGAPVRLVFALGVPEKAAEGHLKILSMLAEKFGDPALRQQLLATDNADEAYAVFIDTPTANRA